MSRIFLAASPLLLLCSIPAAASAQSADGRQCEESRNSAGRSAARGILGGLARGALGRIGGGASVIIPAADILGGAILDLLDCREQQKAVAASDEAVRGGVGTTATWESESRPGVRGASVTEGEEQLADGTHCMTVTDIVIIDGEETRAPKRMCKRPGSGRYARV